MNLKSIVTFPLHSLIASESIKKFYLLPLVALCFTAWATPAVTSLNPPVVSEIMSTHYLVQENDTLRGFVGKPSGADREPEFSKGGMQGFIRYMVTNLRYPSKAKDEGKQGKVIVKFLIEKDGTVNHVRVWRSADPDLDQEAVRLISSMPKWKPAQLNGQPVIMEYTVPVSFTINR